MPAGLAGLVGGPEDTGHAPTAGEEAEEWRRENRAALESANAWVETRGLPLAGHRQF